MSHPKLTSEKELLNAIKDILNASGYMNKMQAELRSKIYEALQRRQSLNTKNHKPPRPCAEIELTNQLIKEYLEWNGYLYTASVMTSETGLSEKKTRQDLCLEVGVKDDEKSSAVPLLSNIVAVYTDRIRKKINKAKKDG